jgi:hypothetical protein
VWGHVGVRHGRGRDCRCDWKVGSGASRVVVSVHVDVVAADVVLVRRVVARMLWGSPSPPRPAPLSASPRPASASARSPASASARPHPSPSLLIHLILLLYSFLFLFSSSSSFLFFSTFTSFKNTLNFLLALYIFQATHPNGQRAPSAKTPSMT